MNVKGKTGDKVTATGIYKNRYGKEISLSVKDTFPACPVEGKEIEWEKVK